MAAARAHSPSQRLWLWGLLGVGVLGAAFWYVHRQESQGPSVYAGISEQPTVAAGGYGGNVASVPDTVASNPAPAPVFSAIHTALPGGGSGIKLGPAVTNA